MQEALSLVPNIEQFILILLRITGYVFISPVFGRKSIPATYKIILSLLLSFIVFTSFDWDIIDREITMIEFVLICIKETGLGMILGFSTAIFFSIFYTAGKIIDTQMGFQMGGLYDPQMNSKVPISGNLLYVFAFLIFIQLDGHLKLIKILHDMFITVPVMGGRLDAAIVNILLNGFYSSFVFAVKLVLPVVLIMLITQFILGVIVKFVPQINVFIIGIPLKIAIGLIVLFFIITPMSEVLDILFERMYDLGMTLNAGMA